MERKKGLLMCLLIALSIPVFASYKTHIYTAYVQDDMPKWKRVIDKMEQQPDKSDAFRLELINYQYGYIGYCLGLEKDNEAERYLDLAEAHLEVLEDKGLYASEVCAYKSAFYGFEIGLWPWKAPLVGGKSLGEAKEAMKLDSTNPNGFLQYANVQFYMPAAFGGSKSEAISYYLKALRLTEKQGFAVRNNWNYLSLLCTIGQAYETTGDYRKAKQYYKLALQKEPRFKWVKDELLPELEKKINKQNG